MIDWLKGWLYNIPFWLAYDDTDRNSLHTRNTYFQWARSGLPTVLSTLLDAGFIPCAQDSNCPTFKCLKVVALPSPHMCILIKSLQYRYTRSLVCFGNSIKALSSLMNNPDVILASDYSRLPSTRFRSWYSQPLTSNTETAKSFKCLGERGRSSGRGEWVPSFPRLLFLLDIHIYALPTQQLP